MTRSRFSHSLNNFRRSSRLSTSTALASLALLALTACGQADGSQSSVASLKPSQAAVTSATTTTSAAVATGKRSALAYSQCMRQHGLADFPDPGADGSLQLEAGPGSDLDMNSPTFKRADTACKSLLPEAAKPPAGLKAANLKYATCMRSHDVKDFPDPQPDGTLQIQAVIGGDLDPNSPTFKAAYAACQKYQPGGGGGGTLSTHSG